MPTKNEEQPNDNQSNDNQTPGNGQNGETPPEQDQQGLTFDTVYGALDASRRGVIDDHINGLRTALQDERSGRKSLEKQLRELSKSADEGSTLKADLDRLAQEQATTNARASFFEQAHDVQVKNLRLAWLAAQDFGLVNEKTGEADFDKLKQLAPELFVTKVTPTANAGSGAAQTGATDSRSMNAFIRAAAGRQ